jgi:hypothetical protein
MLRKVWKWRKYGLFVMVRELFRPSRRVPWGGETDETFVSSTIRDIRNGIYSVYYKIKYTVKPSPQPFPVFENDDGDDDLENWQY